jgi:hypothetical protein
MNSLGFWWWQQIVVWNLRRHWVLFFFNFWSLLPYHYTFLTELYIFLHCIHSFHHTFLQNCIYSLHYYIVHLFHYYIPLPVVHTPTHFYIWSFYTTPRLSVVTHSFSSSLSHAMFWQVGETSTSFL